tara:strand:- start:411 stop:647 length:237 start_codon:yes stop_codon:yes gene_type:complete
MVFSTDLKISLTLKPFHLIINNKSAELPQFVKYIFHKNNNKNGLFKIYIKNIYLIILYKSIKFLFELYYNVTKLLNGL